MAIRERLNALTPAKDSIMAGNSLIISKIHVDKCKVSFQKYVRKRLKEDLTCSATPGTNFTSQQKNKPTLSHRYSARRCESMSEEPSYSPKDKNKPHN